MSSTTEKGREAESFVCDYLSKNGYTVMHRNFICSMGEIDIVAETYDTVVFCEVRLRKEGAAVTGAESISQKKANTMRLCAKEYIKRAHMNDFNARIDVAAISYKDGDEKPIYSMEYIENAVIL